MIEGGGIVMLTISNIITDINRHCAIYNMAESAFTYQIVFYTNEENESKKYCVDSTYEDLRQTLENIIRENITLKNTIVIAQTIIRRDRKFICTYFL